MDNINEMMHTYISFDEDVIKGYTPGDFKKVKGFEELCKRMEYSYDYTEKHLDDYIKSLDIQKAVYEQFVEERKDIAAGEIFILLLQNLAL